MQLFHLNEFLGQNMDFWNSVLKQKKKVEKLETKDIRLDWRVPRHHLAMHLRYYCMYVSRKYVQQRGQD